MNEEKGTRMDDAEQPEVDIFRDTGVRYMGYANELGEAF